MRQLQEFLNKWTHWHYLTENNKHSPLKSEDDFEIQLHPSFKEL